ncbi:MAG: prepilin-type N-terminal cleavage/methylation domain-containing protein [Chthoniobacterales bacterium]
MATMSRHHFSRIALRSPSCHRAFTLIELLVVIAIIAILAAIVLPAVNSARKAAGSAKTVAHLRHIQAADALYASEYDGFFVGNAPFGDGNPYGSPWFAYIPFIKNLGVGAGYGGDYYWPAWGNEYPEALKTGSNVKVSSPPTDGRSRTIAMNMTAWSHTQAGDPGAYNIYWSDAMGTPGKIRMQSVAKPSRFIMFYESCDCKGSMQYRLNWNESADSAQTNNVGMAFRNGGKCNVVFADGHVEALTKKDVTDDTDAKKLFWFDPSLVGVQ